MEYLAPEKSRYILYADRPISQYINLVMKNLSPILTLIVLLFSPVVFGQREVIRVQSCENQSISKQADSLKKLYSEQGYELLKEASVNMESEFEMPVIVPLTQGSWYQFVFIGDYSSRLYEVRMYDWQEKMVIFRQKKWGDVDGNVISYSYVPKFSEFHMMKPVQVNKQKKKNLCGYVMMFKRKADTETGSTTPTQTPSTE